MTHHRSMSGPLPPTSSDIWTQSEHSGERFTDWWLLVHFHPDQQVDLGSWEDENFHSKLQQHFGHLTGASNDFALGKQHGGLRWAGPSSPCVGMWAVLMYASICEGVWVCDVWEYVWMCVRERESVFVFERKRINKIYFSGYVTSTTLPVSTTPTILKIIQIILVNKGLHKQHLSITNVGTFETSAVCFTSCLSNRSTDR